MKSVMGARSHGQRPDFDVVGLPEKGTGRFNARAVETFESSIGAMRKELFEELLESVKQAKSIERGELKPSRVFKVNPRSDVARVRGKLGLTQPKFAALLGISTNTLQNWEQGRRAPTGPAKVLLKIVSRHPKILLKVA
jgi:putative transcriptional regulator